MSEEVNGFPVMFTREDKFNTSVAGIQAVMNYIAAKPETLFILQLPEAKHIIRWEYVGINGDIKSVTIAVKSAFSTLNYSCIVYNKDKLVPYPLNLKLKKEGFQLDYVAYYNLSNGFCNLIPAKKLAQYIYSHRANDFRVIDVKSVGDRAKDKLALVPMTEIIKHVGCKTRKIA